MEMQVPIPLGLTQHLGHAAREQRRMVLYVAEVLLNGRGKCSNFIS